MNSTYISTLSLLLISTMGLGGCGNKTPEDHFHHGKDLLAKGDRQGAILELKTTLQAQPTNSEARLLLGKADLANGAYPEAEKEFRQARENGAVDDQVLPLLAKALLGKGEPQQTLDLGIPTHTFGPQSRAALYTARAAALLSLDKQTEAAQAVSAAEQADANYPDLLLLKAKLAMSKQDKPQAMQLLDSILKQDAKFIDALYLKGALLKSEGKTDDALKTYQQIIAIDPKQYRANLAIYSLHLQAKNMEAADQDLQAAEKVAAKNLLVKYARGTFEIQRGKLDKASSALLEVLRVAPNHIPSQLAYAMTSYGLGNYDQSLKSAGKVLGAEPDNLIAGKILASSQLKVGDVKGALKTLDPFLAKHADDAKLLALTGEAHLQAKDYEKAQNYLDKAAEREPENAAIKTSQAAGQLAMGDRQDALADLEKAASLNSKAGKADLALVMLHLKGQEYDEAIQAIDNLEKKLSANPVTFNLRAAALLGKKDLAGARKALGQALAIQPNFFPAAYNLAKLDMQANMLEAARKRFESILAHDKDNVKAMLALADLAAAEKNDKDYVSWIEKAIKADPNAVHTYVPLVRYYLAKKENNRALSLAKQAANANPEDLGALNLLGTTQMSTGDNRASLDTYNRLAQKAPNSPQAYVSLALAQIVNKQQAAARVTLQSALKLNPDLLKAQDALMRLDLEENKPDAALGIARQIQTQRPKSPLGFDREADILQSQKRYPEAIKAYEQALSNGAGTVGLIKIHRALMLAGNTKSATQRLAGWLKQHPADAAIRDYAAEFYMAKGQDREAIAQYEAVIKLVPQSPRALNNLAILYQRVKDNRALATAEQVIKLAPQNPGVQDTLGWILVDQGHTARGIEFLRKAVATAPNMPTISYHYAVALVRSGNKAQAKKVLEKTLSAGESFPEREAAKALIKEL